LNNEPKEEIDKVETKKNTRLCGATLFTKEGKGKQRVSETIL